MLIEIFTDGKVKVDGQDISSKVAAEHILRDYLLNPESLPKRMKKAA
ncbi:MAG: hypothetical protein HQM10_14860 [Candidatus Riflebacteria bacterium]|nr:hypothetical protein [Candidatus Riflebacteria bacterium]